MYFVNPHYRKPLLSEEQQKTLRAEIQSILSIPKYDRRNEDKKKVYYYFIQNPYLSEIQKRKSLRARILCTAQIQLLSINQYEKTQKGNLKESLSQQINQSKHQSSQGKQHPYVIVQRFKDTDKLAVLKNEVKQKILRHDESKIKLKMEQIKEYCMIKRFQYYETLYLSHFLERVSDISFKQFLFQENDKVDYVYFIQDGEFQVFKDFQLLKEKSMAKLDKVKSKSNIDTPLQLMDETAFKNKEIKLKKQEVLRFTGGFGQSFGEMQFFLESQTRFYSLKCNSSASTVFRIHFKHFNEIFKENRRRFDKIKLQYVKKFQADQQKFKQNQKLKHQLILGEKDPFIVQRSNSSENNKVSSIIFEMENKMSLQNSHVQGSFTLPSNSTIIFVNQSNAAKNLARTRKLYSQNAKKYKNNRYESRLQNQLVNSLKQNHSKSNQGRNSEFESPFFPVISKETTEKKVSQNFRLPLIMNKAKKHNKVKGLMDISTIIEQKQQLLSSISNLQNPQFSFYKLDQKHAKKLNLKRAQLSKLNDEENSAAHSENFIKSLVKRSLKKSGYLVQSRMNQYQNVPLYDASRLRTQSVVNTSSFSVLEDSQNLGLQSICGKTNPINRQIRSSLANNDFDQFFYKI